MLWLFNVLRKLLIFTIHLPLQLLNIAVWGSAILLLTPLKLVCSGQSRLKVLGAMNQCIKAFAIVCFALVRFFNRCSITINLNAELDKDKWYLITANHVSYFDIPTLLYVISQHTSPAKFFLKQELIWLPFVGTAAWALEMPFMRRYSQHYLAKHPHKKGEDLATTKRYCERFAKTPTTVINFVEGTRFTQRKRARQQSQYTHLLRPKAGGIAFTLASMGTLFDRMLDVSLIYQHKEANPSLAVLVGAMNAITIDVNVLPLSSELFGDYYNDQQFKQSFQAWLNDYWMNKDQKMAELNQEI